MKMKVNMLGGKFKPIAVERRGFKTGRIVKSATLEHIASGHVWVSFDDEPTIWYPIPTSDISSMEIERS